jgi:periplasmic protein CpxP/Spy
MKTMRNTLFTLALGGMLALGATSALYAQDSGAQQQGQWGHGHHQMDPDAQLAHMTKALNLSSDQQGQIKPLLVDRQQKMQALFQDQSLSREDRHSKMMAIQQDTHAKIEAVLNDQQKQKFDAMHERGPHGGENAPQEAAPQPQ